MPGVHKKSWDYTNAIDGYKQALTIYTALDEKKEMAVTHNQLAWLYFQKKEYKAAEDDAAQGLALARETNYNAGMKDADRILDTIHSLDKKKERS